MLRVVDLLVCYESLFFGLFYTNRWTGVVSCNHGASCYVALCFATPESETSVVFKALTDKMSRDSGYACLHILLRFYVLIKCPYFNGFARMIRNH